jgi:serine/tyrosine/threonine adenylyltransferase
LGNKHRPLFKCSRILVDDKVKKYSGNGDPMRTKKENIEAGWNLENSYANLPKSFYSSVHPTPVPSPKLMILNQSLAESLGLNVQDFQEKDGVDILSGNGIPEGSFPIAQAYAGHQFGHFTMLGDGRAILLGEQITPLGERFDIQLKGSGITPYSRGGDGRATLGPMLREYIISEAMHALGIPTTRSLSVVTTGELVKRETPLPGAILTRVGKSHIRVGTFEYTRKFGSVEEVKALADYTLKRHFHKENLDENPYLCLLREVIKGQARLIAQWQLVGFIHGVMNTDNMAISGETIDYGPCAFMDAYDPKTVFSSIDIYGRYAYGNQSQIALWNLSKFAETLLPLLHVKKDHAITIVQDALSDFSKMFHENWYQGMRSKLGIFHGEPQDEALIQELLGMMKKVGADYTNTFRAFTLDKPEETILFGREEFTKWHKEWKGRLEHQKESKEEALQLMKHSNPGIIPRNHRVEEALEAAVKDGNLKVMIQFLDVLKTPYEYSPKQENYISPPKPSNYPYRTFCGT